MKKKLKHVVMTNFIVYTIYLCSIFSIGSFIVYNFEALPISMSIASFLIGIILLLTVLAIHYSATSLTKLMKYQFDSVEQDVLGWYEESEHTHNPVHHYAEVEQFSEQLHCIFSNFKDELDSLRIESSIDPLTNIKNRRTLDTILDKWIREQRKHSVIMIDLDHFKYVNDNFGHAVGDSVLKFVAQQMKKVTRNQDVNCRYGGEEFMILLPNTEIEEAYIIADELRTIMATTNSPCGHPVTVSLGVASFPEHGVTADSLLEKVDTALYIAKKNGRNAVEIA